jgi:hypothetical protein
MYSFLGKRGWRIFIVSMLASCFTRANASTIHVIGDSHACAFSGIDGCIPHWIGSITMHRVGRDGLGVVDFKKIGVKDGDVAVFAFGEIDVRCHIGKQRDEMHRNLDEIIEKLVSDYLNTVILNRQSYKDLICIVYLVVPPSDNVYNPNFPRYGTLDDRVMITRKINEKLLLEAKKNNIGTLDVYNQFCDSNGALKKEVSDGGVHISPTSNGIIREKLHEILH